jgi:hypothetical protein
MTTIPNFASNNVVSSEGVPVQNIDLKKMAKYISYCNKQQKIIEERKSEQKVNLNPKKEYFVVNTDEKEDESWCCNECFYTKNIYDIYDGHENYIEHKIMAHLCYDCLTKKTKKYGLVINKS